MQELNRFLCVFGVWIVDCGLWMEVLLDVIRFRHISFKTVFFFSFVLFSVVSTFPFRSKYFQM